MLFNSLQFVIFFIIVYCLYLFLGHKWQNRMLLLASCIFYGAWDWRFLFLMFASITTDYFCGLKIAGSGEERKRRFFLVLSISVNLLILGFFKYFNFFSANLSALLNTFGLKAHPLFIQIILPVGISFYTFQTMSYTIDVYRRQITAVNGYLDYALFISFFPQLVAGPIMRAKDLLSQVTAERKMRLDWIYEGGFLIAWGLFQKMFVADNLARIVDPLFASYGPYRGGVVLLSLYIFTFQIYCDFAGYSNIARGLGKLMGFDIMVNFNLPLFATDPQDFWSRWHISLTTWIRDYVYTPLFMFLRFLRGNIRLCAAIVLSMLIFGLWHGAAWHFVFFGLYWGVILSAYSLLRLLPVRPTAGSNGFARALWFAARVLFMFNLVSVGMLFFRAQSMAQAGEMLRAIVFNFLPLRASGIKLILAQAVFFIWFLTAIEALQFFKKGQFAVFRLRPALQFGVYLLIIYSLLLFGVTSNERFIYFQF